MVRAMILYLVRCTRITQGTSRRLASSGIHVSIKCIKRGGTPMLYKLGSSICEFAAARPYKALSSHKMQMSLLSPYKALSAGAFGSPCALDRNSYHPHDNRGTGGCYAAKIDVGAHLCGHPSWSLTVPMTGEGRLLLTRWHLLCTYTRFCSSLNSSWKVACPGDQGYKVC